MKGATVMILIWMTMLLMILIMFIKTCFKTLLHKKRNRQQRYIRIWTTGYGSSGLQLEAPLSSLLISLSKDRKTISIRKKIFLLHLPAPFIWFKLGLIRIWCSSHFKIQFVPQVLSQKFKSWIIPRKIHLLETFNEKIPYSCHNVSKCFRKKFNGISGIPSFSDAICQSFINWQANTSAVVNSASEEKTGKFCKSTEKIE